jgi:16S rRNA (cytosine967-C5)-methyltransferase
MRFQQKKISPERRSRVRQVTVQLLTKAEREGFFVDHELEAILQREAMPRRDRALATMLVNGITRMRARLDYEIATYYQREYDRAPELLKNILRLAFYQFEFLDRIPDYAIISESVHLAKNYFGEARGGLVNAILRERQRRPTAWPPIEAMSRDVDLLAAYFSHPRWMLEKWLRRMSFGELKELCDANNRIPGITMRVVRPERNAKEFEQHTRTWRIGVEALPGAPHFYRPLGSIDTTSLAAIRQGLCVVQDVSAGLPARLMAPKAGETIYDLCAAPGGKALQMAESDAKVTAVEINPNRARLIEEAATRIGAAVEVKVADATTFSAEPADGVLVDAPCSGLGVLAKRADLRWRRRPEDLAQLTELQLRLLKNAAGLVKPGGRLVYSTCTIEPEENEMVVRAFLERHPEFHLVPAYDFVSEIFCDIQGFIRTKPQISPFGMDGSFAARLEKAL